MLERRSVTMDFATLAVIFSLAAFGLNIFDRVYGIGNRAASVKASLQKYTDDKVEKLRTEVYLKHDTTEGNIGQSLVAIKDMLHKMELEAERVRATAAETYMRRDSYYKASEELKRDVTTALDKIDKRLERIEGTMSGIPRHA